MGYTIRIREQVTPKNVVRRDPVTRQEVLRPTPVPTPVNPTTFVQLIFSPLTNNEELIYEPETSGRCEIWEDTSGTVTLTQIDAVCPQFRIWREKFIRAGGEARLNAIASPYSPSERETWPYQREECLAYNRDNATATPFCDIIAQRRGIPRELFLAKVKENMDLFSAASAIILGQQQALIDQIYAATTIEGVLGIDWL